MRKLEGCDDRALVLEDNHLSALRWGSEESRFPPRLRLVAILAVGLLGSLPGVARAADYCVGSVPGCSGTAAAGVQEALNLAAGSTTEADRVLIGPGTYSRPDGFAYSSGDAANTVDVVGVGSARPTLTATGAAPTVLAIAQIGSSVSGLEIVLPNVADAKGLSLGDNVAEDLVIRGPVAPSIKQTGASIGSGGTIADSTITIPAGQPGTFGIDVGTMQPATVRDSTISARIGIRIASEGVTTTIRRNRISSIGEGIFIAWGLIEIDNTLIDLAGGSLTPSTGIGARASASVPTTAVDARHLIIRNGNAQSVGIGAYADHTTEAVTVTLRNSIIRDVASALDLQTFTACMCSGTVTVDSASNDYDQTTNNASGDGVEDINQAAIVNVDPLFVNPVFGTAGLSGDYRLGYDSQLIDKGEASVLGSGEFDLGGNPRIVDGVAPFSGAARDIGAHEYQRLAPTAQAGASVTSAASGDPVGFDSAGSTDPDGDPLTFAWSFDDGGSATGATANHAFATGGAHTATLTVTDPTGLTATDVASVQIDDSSAPNQKLSGKKKQDIDKLALRVRSDEDAMLVGKGSVTVPGAAKKKTLRFKRVKRAVTAGKTVKLRFKLPKKAERVVKNAIARGPAPKAKLKVTATDGSGNKSVAKRTVTLTD